MFHGRRYIGGWVFREPIKEWLRRQLVAVFRSPPPETRPEIVARRARHATLRAKRWTRANIVAGRPRRRIPRHIKQMMRETRP